MTATLEAAPTIADATARLDEAHAAHERLLAERADAYAKRTAALAAVEQVTERVGDGDATPAELTKARAAVDFADTRLAGLERRMAAAERNVIAAEAAVVIAEIVDGLPAERAALAEKYRRVVAVVSAFRDDEAAMRVRVEDTQQRLLELDRRLREAGDERGLVGHGVIVNAVWASSVAYTVHGEDVPVMVTDEFTRAAVNDAVPGIDPMLTGRYPTSVASILGAGSWAEAQAEDGGDR